MSTLNRVTILGSGVLGGQIAWHSAFKGKTVTVYNRTEASLPRCRATLEEYAAAYRRDLGAGEADITATWARLRFSSDLAAAVADADLVIESVPEIPEVKISLYSQLAPLLPAHTLLATNSSTFLPRDFAEATGRPAQYCALHFANMIWVINLLEIMAHPGTAKSTLRQVTEFAVEIGMLPIAVQKEQNGYVLNTWLVTLLNAAQTLVTNGVSTPEDVDRTYLVANPGATTGPLGIIDLIGMKTLYDILSHWGQAKGDEQMQRNAAYLKTRFLDQGQLGLHAGQGYYRYPEPAYRDPQFLQMPDAGGVAAIVERSYLGKDTQARK